MNFNIPGGSNGKDTTRIDTSQVDQDLKHISTFPLLLKTNIILTYIDRSELPSEYAAALVLSENDHPFIKTWERCLAAIDTEISQRQHYLDTVRAINAAGGICQPATFFLDAINTESKRIDMHSQEIIYHIRRYVSYDWIEEMTEDTAEQRQNHFQRLRDIAYILWVDQKCPREESKMEPKRRAAALRIARDSSVIRMPPLSSVFRGITWIAKQAIDRFKKHLFKSINTEWTTEEGEKILIVQDWVRANESLWVDYHVVMGGMPPDAFEQVNPLEEFRLRRQREMEQEQQALERLREERLQALRGRERINAGEQIGQAPRQEEAQMDIEMMLQWFEI